MASNNAAEKENGDTKMNIENAQALIKTLKEAQAKPLSAFESAGYFDDNLSEQERKDAIIEKLILQIEWALDEKSSAE